MKIFGLEKLSMVDYPGHLCCTVFTGGCNFRCPFCQNSDLVNMQHLQEVFADDFFEFLDKRKKILDSVCISGGEPTLYNDLPSFIRKIKSLGFLVKLDTNGTNFDMLKFLIENKLVDYVAMDIKNSQSLYPKTAGIKNCDIDNILKSVELLKKNFVDYEFRTTILKGYHDDNSILEISKWLSGAKRIFLQKFVDSGSCLQPGLEPIEKNDAEKFRNILLKTIPEVNLRGY